jgi:hypothetical protein
MDYTLVAALARLTGPTRQAVSDEEPRVTGKEQVTAPVSRRVRARTASETVDDGPPVRIATARCAVYGAGGPAHIAATFRHETPPGPGDATPTDKGTTIWNSASSRRASPPCTTDGARRRTQAGVSTDRHGRVARSPTWPLTTLRRRSALSR